MTGPPQSPARRDWLAVALATAVAPGVIGAATELLPPARARRVLVLGGGWAGLSAARRLRDLAPALEVVVIEREERFWSHPLSNRWLVGLIPAEALGHDLGVAASHWGYRLVKAEVTAIDRARRVVDTNRGRLGYDWLVIAAGVDDDYTAWFGADPEAARQARHQFPAAFTAPAQTAQLREKIESFAGGRFLMTIPPAPYRCPPAPYERAMMIAWRFKQKGIKGRLVLIDANGPPLGFERVFREHYRDWIEYLPHARIHGVDPFNRFVETDFDRIAFDDAVLMPPQRAAAAIALAGVAGVAGASAAWARHDPVHLHAQDDERVFVVGDALGPVSAQFGQYPKTGQAASRQGAIVAGEIAARAEGRLPQPVLPDSTCYVTLNVEPAEVARVEGRYRLRLDGAIVGASQSHFDPQPRGEDRQWLAAMLGEFLAPDQARRAGGSA